MQAILALARKDLTLLLRDKPGFFFTFGFPILYALFFGMIFSGAGGGGGGDGGSRIPIVVVDLDGSDGARAFVEALAGADELRVDEAPTVPEAADLVRRGRRTAYVVITEGFGVAGERMFWGETARLEVGVDPSRSAEAGMLQGLLTKYAFQRMQLMFTDPGVMRDQAVDALAAVGAADDMPPGVRSPLQDMLRGLEGLADGLEAEEDAGTDGGDGSDGATNGNAGADADTDTGANPTAGWQPVEIEMTAVTGDPADDDDGPTSSFAISFPQGIVWGVMACAAAFGISIVVERTRGTLVRLSTAPITRRQILAGKAAACFVTTVGVATILLLVAAALGVRPGWAAVPKLALAVVCVAAAFVGIMMLLSVLGKTEAAAGGIGWGVLIVMAMIGGGMIPLVVMPGWMQSIASISPVKWAILAMEGAIWRGYSYPEMLLPCAVLVGVGVVGFGTGVAAFRWTGEAGATS
ncbi:MAG: ABC transporter permease [Planctomycetota bacterium]|jgi:ABC-2 type transport system permease protein